MAKSRWIWDAIVGPNVPGVIVGYDIRRWELPIGLARTLPANSREWAGLQLADVLAGSVTRSVTWINRGRTPQDHFAEQLADVWGGSPFNHEAVQCIWPSTAISPDELGTVGDDALSPHDFIGDIIRTARSGAPK